MRPAPMNSLRMKVYLTFALLFLGGLALYKILTSDELVTLGNRMVPLVDSIKQDIKEKTTGKDSGIPPMGNSVYEALSGRLPEQEGWRTFAKPLGLADGSLLLFQRSGISAIVWHVDWKTNKVSSFPVPEIKLETEGRYTALASRDGIWLLGEVTVLIQPSSRGLKALWGGAENEVLNERRIFLKTQFNEPVATLLKDQSVLVLGPSMHGAKSYDEVPRMKQLRLDSRAQALVMQDRGILSYSGKPNENGQAYRVPRFGHGAVTLESGQVLLFGGDVTTNLASLIDPNDSQKEWIQTPTAAMPNQRVFGVAKNLPGGRVLITGAPNLNCYGESAKMRSVDVYEIKTRQWSSLPLLPMVPCSTAYGADVPSVTLTPNGSIVVAGYLESQAMILRADAQSSTGYEKNWQVVGPMPIRRISGVVHALSDQVIVIAGGVDRRHGQCCYATSGFDVLPLIRDSSSKVVQSMMWIEPAVAQKGALVFAGGGRHFGSTGFGQLRYNAAAELMNRSTGQIEQLPNIPFASGAAQAVWLDGNRILYKGMKESAHWGLSSYTPPSSGAMAIYMVKEKLWTAPLTIPGLENAQLISAEGMQAIFLQSQQVLRLDLETKQTTTIQPAQRSRIEAQVLPLPDGHRLLLAGGKVQQEAVSVLNTECESIPGKDCPERFAGFGGYLAQAKLEILSIQKWEFLSDASLAVRWPGGVNSIVLTNQGRVMIWSNDAKTERQAILQTNAAATDWEEITHPEFSSRDNGRCGACALLSSVDPKNPGRNLIFFRQGAIDMDHMEDELDEQNVRVWLWDESNNQWLQVLQTQGMASRSTILPLGEPLSAKEGKRMMSVGWHLRSPVIWMDP